MLTCGVDRGEGVSAGKPLISFHKRRFARDGRRGRANVSMHHINDMRLPMEVRKGSERVAFYSMVGSRTTTNLNTTRNVRRPTAGLTVHCVTPTFPSFPSR